MLTIVITIITKFNNSSFVEQSNDCHCWNVVIDFFDGCFVFLVYIYIIQEKLTNKSLFPTTYMVGKSDPKRWRRKCLSDI